VELGAPALEAGLNARRREANVSPTWLLAVLGPLLVFVGLAGLGSVAAVFASYHLGLCLLVPALLARREGLGLSEHVRRLGLSGPGTRRGIVLGLALGPCFALAAPAAFVLTPELFPAADRLRAVLQDWSVDPARFGLVFAFLVLCNGPAEELFWRGYLQERLVSGRCQAVWLVLLFASYHVLTVGRLAPGPSAAASMLGGIVLAASLWTWTRHRWGSVWPALLSHAGATVGWAAVAWHLLR
jgi:membrane protease YdiL (CAAX protease family)